MRTFNTAAHVSLILCLGVAGAFVGNAVYSQDPPSTYYPDHECKEAQHCQELYWTNEPDCVPHDPYLHCKSTTVSLFKKCRLTGTGCTENRQSYGYTGCAGTCCRIEQGTLVCNSMYPCTYEFDHCP
jgi:hypothetical protein